MNGKFVIELVGDREPVGDSRSEPVDILNGGLKGNELVAVTDATDDIGIILAIFPPPTARGYDELSGAT